MAPFCKAANDQSDIIKNLIKEWVPGETSLRLNNKQIQTIPQGLNLNLPGLIHLFLNDNLIQAIPEDLNLPPQLILLRFDNNHISYIDPKILEHFSGLHGIKLNKNPLTQENVDELRKKVAALRAEKGRGILIYADDMPVTTILEIDPAPVKNLLAGATTVEIDLPENNPTGLATATLDLDKQETFTAEKFKELVDETGTGKFVIGFAQDAKGKWHPTFFDPAYFEAYSKTQGDQIKDPATRQLIQYIVPLVTVIKEG